MPELTTTRRRFGIRAGSRAMARNAAPLLAPPTPTWLDSLIFLALMTGPPKFVGDREVTASLAGQIDAMVLIQIGAWASGALWVIARLFPPALRRGAIPSLHPLQITAWLLIAALSLSLPQSPGILLTAFTLGQYSVMLSFGWLFVHRYGASAYLRLLFIGACLLALIIVAALIVAPELVVAGTRVRGDMIADAGTVAAIGLVFCFSNVPAMRTWVSWGMGLLFAAMLVTARTRIAFVAVLLNFAIAYIYGKGLRVRKLVPLLAALSLGVVVLDVVAPVTEYMIRDTESLETMSDRIPLWQYLTAIVMQQAPWTGLGYFAASRVWAPEYNPGLGNAHSAFFEILLGGGIVAASVYLVLCAALVWYAWRLLNVASRHPEVIATVGLLVVTLLTGITSLGVHVGPNGFTFWSLSTLLPAMWRQYARVQNVDQRVEMRRFRLRAHAAVEGRSILS